MSKRPSGSIRVIPNSHVTELPGQGHGALVGAPHLVADAINDFIGRLPERHDLRLLPHVQPGDGPTDDHALNLRRALKNGEAHGDARSFRR